MLQGRNEDEIYLSERQKMDAAAAAKLPKVCGYIGPVEYNERVARLSGGSDALRRSGSNLNVSVVELDRQTSNEQLSTSCQLPLASSAAKLTNSSSKSNSKSVVLRENYDSDQRPRSGQKLLGFSGRDQKNVSPYNDKQQRQQTSSYKKILVGGGGGGVGATSHSNVMKAKRQISFDS